MNLRRILSQVALVIGTLVFAIGLQAYAQTYTAPPATPPNGNAQAPLDTGSSPNTKSGPLQVNGFANIGASYFVGNVGIGTLNPAGKLDVEGGTLCLNNSCINSWPAGAAPGTAVYVCPSANSFSYPGNTADFSGRCGSTTCNNGNTSNFSTQSTCSFASTWPDGACAPGGPISYPCNFIGHLSQ